MWVLSQEDAEWPAELVGNKAAVLHRLHRVTSLRESAVQVPRAFVVTTEAWETFCTDKIAMAVRSLHSTPEDQLADQLSDVRELIRNSPVPEELRADIEDSIRGLTEEFSRPVACRSSGLAEDGVRHSYAGLYESYLNLESLEEIWDGIRRCWASAFSLRRIQYSRAYEDGSYLLRPQLAVLVQQTVIADKAGVLFTEHPLRAGSGQILVEAVWGLGATLAGGTGSPEHVVLDRQGCTLERLTSAGGLVAMALRGSARYDLRLGDEVGVPGGGLARVMGVNREDWTAYASLPDDYEGRPILTESELTRLAALGMTIQQALGAPQDIEWAFTGDALFLLQSRTITTAISGPERTAGADAVENPEVEVLARGVPASPGVAQGSVTVATTPDEAGRVGAGDVLVTRTTTPDYFLAMLRAAAIVAEEGGVLSHTAILSREMGKPCILAVDGATQRFVSGMEVTVDGTTGVITAGKGRGVTEAGFPNGGPLKSVAPEPAPGTQTVGQLLSRFLLWLWGQPQGLPGMPGTLEKWLAEFVGLPGTPATVLYAGGWGLTPEDDVFGMPANWSGPPFAETLQGIDRWVNATDLARFLARVNALQPSDQGLRLVFRADEPLPRCFRTEPRRVPLCGAGRCVSLIRGEQPCQASGANGSPVAMH